jgi:hypothetical protein
MHRASVCRPLAARLGNIASSVGDCLNTRIWPEYMALCGRVQFGQR